MPSLFSVIEPHPSVSKTAYISGGIGGAGNFRRYKAEEVTQGSDATGPASRVPLQKQPKKYVPSGRGGAGNMFSRHEEGIFQFDEEMMKSRDAQQAPVYRVGRGGAGNFYSERKTSSLRKDSTDSGASSDSERASIRNVLTRQMSGGVLSIFSRRSS
ncbi:unnamed protein product [Zymoseptoria tritici ST99CH_1A5]|uniref:Uncharacterized protein n=4 Tax=Zymoseptoria tritici TaxID=1047171 RepID=F9WW79_ZYMTI|nr:uncharacterized protein MYCGRDRAFT_102108 [Zymoseptoria tritici IPO323]SMQ45217.1 unnamed protein product [Zymoseptoria tritici ST99CH_3D7]SMR41583.1 unnamed protein product [Zymoseptoria tritici ST99CH_1E4]SMR43772.1 unnamed protein product [Zymoseptoria tritici ST99CH_3D1]SMY18932.1 unnamed protein product [Zymoseptoria tritici ST99CH_1A5]EGP90965.1 hypothetical protein MYCGRDRAFT_102108 [Zymoseptoria tritici IPO323]